MVSAQQSDELALDTHARRQVALRLVGAIRGIEADHSTLPTEVLQRRFGAVDQRHDDLAVASRVALADERIVSIEDAGFHHRVAGHLERVMLAGPE